MASWADLNGYVPWSKQLFGRLTLGRFRRNPADDARPRRLTGLKDSSPDPSLAPERTKSVRSSVPGGATVFQAPSGLPVPPPTDSPNDRIACRFPYLLRRDGNSIHITRQEFPEESVRAQSELRNRQPQTHTYHRAFEGRGDCAILAPTDTPDSNPAAGTIVPFGRRAIFAKGQQSCESRRDPSHASGGL